MNAASLAVAAVARWAGLLARARWAGPLALTALLVAAPAASAHAVLEATSPQRGAALERPPELVSFGFNEPVEASFGALRVFDARGERVETGGVERPGGHSERIGVRLPGELADGTYTATYRVISADGHPVTGGFVFSVGDPGAAPAATVGELVDTGRAGPVTEIAFGAVRALAYAAIALALGGVAFLTLAWRPALRRSPPSDAAAEAAASRRFRLLLGAAVVAGGATSALGIVLQGATAAGTSFWSALDPDVVGEVLDTRFGTVWGLRLVAWLALGAALALRPRPALVALPLACIAVSPALAGHASTQDPLALLLPLGVVHVVAMSLWVGGIAALLAVVPAATRRLEPPARTPLLAGTVGRFSGVALVAVIAILLSGTVQSLVHVRTLANLTETAFGRAVLIKIGIVYALVALGALQRRRSIPGLRRAAAGGEPPGTAGRILRRALRAELVLMVCALGVTAALVSYAPSVAETSGPVSRAADLGPARLELTVDPAAVGANEVHIYLFDERDGSQYDETKELDMSIELPDKDVGPLELRARKAGPGHYVVQRAEIGIAGDWLLRVSARVSEFDAHEAKVELPVR